MDQLVQLLRADWGVISRSWGAVAALCAAAAGLSFTFAKTLYEREIATLKADLASAQGVPAAEKMRSLTKGQVDAIFSALSGTQQATVGVEYDDKSVDGARLAQDISAAFRQAGWRVDDLPAVGVIDPPSSGIAFRVYGRPPLTQAQQQALDALRRAGLRPALWRNDQRPNPFPNVGLIIVTSRSRRPAR